ncbi:hypothetical protein BCR39DRAFT_24616 [Naematelia encephala]|uniref:Uncharacterized protein n=1 Tax=Naematelia encephala TaxID=71784 RepID=A0A1Y2BN98_9TREE|nr:hypothetical protein BCR39DRAFT_24616 [Naematelia encephala]
MMPQSSQSSTLVRPKALSQEKNSTMRSNPTVSTRPQLMTQSVGVNDTRPSKRPRLSPAKKPNTNAFAVPRRYAHSGGSQSLHKAASRKDEKALLDDLMAGLDASMFENLASSPAKISTSQVKPRTPLAVKHEVQISTTSRTPVRFNANVKSAKEDALPCSVKLEHKNETNEEAIVDIKTDKRKARSLSPVFVKAEPKVDIADDELYDFDFDLGDLSGLNDDELLQPQQVQVRAATELLRQLRLT